MPGFTLILLAGSISFGGPRRAPEPERWLAKDKLLHFAGSAVIHGTAHTLLRNNRADYPTASAAAAGTTLLIGGLKEWYDSRGNGDPSWRDFAADAAGAGTGAILMRQIDR